MPVTALQLLLVPGWSLVPVSPRLIGLGAGVSVGSGAGVAPVQAASAIRMTVSTVVKRSNGFGIGGGPSFGEVHLPFYRATGLFLSPLQSAIHGRSSGCTRRRPAYDSNSLNHDVNRYQAPGLGVHSEERRVQAHQSQCAGSVIISENYRCWEFPPPPPE